MYKVVVNQNIYDASSPYPVCTILPIGVEPPQLHDVKFKGTLADCKTWCKKNCDTIKNDN